MAKRSNVKLSLLMQYFSEGCMLYLLILNDVTLENILIIIFNVKSKSIASAGNHNACNCNISHFTNK